MAIIYTIAGGFGPTPNISAFILAAQAAPAAPTGPMPGALVHAAATNLGVHGEAAQNIGMASAKTVALGLITCASVIYVSTDPAAAALCWVHHANAGHVTVANVVNARLQLGNPPWASILVVFAHPGIHDPGYLASTNLIAAQGVPANNIVEIPNLLVGQFGANNLGCIGY